MSPRAHPRPPLWRWRLAALALSLGCAGGEGGEAAEPYLHAPRGSVDVLMAGLPENEDLPIEIKADLVIPARFDLIDTQGPVLDQGERGTCTKFSSLGLLQHLHLKAGIAEVPHFSAQHLQWSVKIESGATPQSEGDSIFDTLRTLQRFGAVEERFWPYNKKRWDRRDHDGCKGDGSFGQPLTCFTQGDPTSAALHAPRWRLGKPRGINNDPRNIKAYMIEHQSAVLLSATTFDQAWGTSRALRNHPSYYRDGIVPYPNARDMRESRVQGRLSGHAVMIVGWDDHKEIRRLDERGRARGAKDEGAFLIKNSWGTGNWGSRNEPEGYGWIPYAYVKDHGRILVAQLDEAPPTEACGEAVDRDLDGKIACEDEGCFWDPRCAGEGEVIDTYRVEHRADIEDARRGRGAPITSDLQVRGGGRITGVAVHVDFRHDDFNELEITLQRLDARGEVIAAQRLWTRDVDDAWARLDKRLELRDETMAFDGQPAEGAWRLEIRDAARGNSGRLYGWSLELRRAYEGGPAEGRFYASEGPVALPSRGADFMELQIPHDDLISDAWLAIALDAPDLPEAFEGYIRLQRIAPGAAIDDFEAIEDEIVIYDDLIHREAMEDPRLAQATGAPLIVRDGWTGLLARLDGLEGRRAAGNWRLLINTGRLRKSIRVLRWGLAFGLGAEAITRHLHPAHVPLPVAQTGVSELELEEARRAEGLELITVLAHPQPRALGITVQRFDAEGVLLGEATPRIADVEDPYTTSHEVRAFELPEFEGQPMTGRWRILVDNESAYEGELVSWGLQLGGAATPNPAPPASEDPLTLVDNEGAEIPQMSRVTQTLEMDAPHVIDEITITAMITHEEIGGLRIRLGHDHEEIPLFTPEAGVVYGEAQRFEFKTRAFDGADARGSWRLVIDNPNPAAGRLEGWSLAF